MANCLRRLVLSELSADHQKMSHNVRYSDVQKVHHRPGWFATVSQTKARHTTLVKLCLNTFLCRTGLASTTGIQVLGVGKKVPLRSESQEDGISSRYKKHLSILTMCYLRVSSTLPTTEDARFSTTRQPCNPILTSSPFTFMIPDGIYLFKSWKEIKDGLCKEYYHGPHVVEHHLTAGRTLPCEICIFPKYTPKNEVLRRSSSSQSVPL